ncbi:filamentous hemagglutinin N-terminal domain-containing protein [Nodosilinea sp. FACHB-13]|uniref:two-partner secretion domain-containing protein n=1 Tax=Cyanophyceae TaxID=3028117 RepID=UPI001689D3F7|nr:filamentous hemagglutinin N-terminal domain-containing protein [Nodosilinea sp. FACHB-13]MBD2110038.1 filamentous hemagglutinin N-terminal domain-containing protein [Nodosilinea sp. FACHB-13]
MGIYQLDVIRTICPLVTGAGFVLLAMVLSPPLVQAQVTPDATLPLEGSTVTSDGTTYQITGGATRGSNLFHSFEQFSVPAGTTAVFVNADNIANILSRVTGSTPSDLQGTIQAGGNANLFLINPAGMVFGPNARLDIGGSFLASTGEGLQFENGFVYSTANPEVPPLLTISAPIGLNLSNALGNIAVVGANLSVAADQTLALVGGEVSLTGAQLAAPGGRLQIGSGQQASELGLTVDRSGFEVNFGGISRAGNIQLSNRSVLNASGRGGGAIALQGQAITLANQSALLSDTLGDQDGRGVQIVADQFRLLDSSYIGAATSGSGAGSSIDVTANDIEIVGTAIANYKLVEFKIFLGARQISDREIGGIAATTVAAGRAGDISLNARNILIDEGVLVSTESFGTGNGGDIDITATESLSLTGSGLLGGSRVSGIPVLTLEGTPSGLATGGIPAGSGGNININTARLTIAGNGAIGVGTQSDQDSGNLVINATESVTLQGGSVEPYIFPTQITTISLGGSGAAGDIQITTGRLALLDGALMFADSGVRTVAGIIPLGGPAGNVTITATESVDIIGSQPLGASLLSSTVRSRTFTDAPAGSVQITTPNLTLRDGGQVTSATLNEGAGGAITIDAENIFVSGAASEDADSISGIFANSGTELLVSFNTGAVESVPASGAGGAITIKANTLTVQDTAEVTVGSFGSGEAGNLAITANAIRLANNGRLTATTTSDRGGNITLTANTLTLDNSSITASSERGDGGNLTFNLRDFLLLRNGGLISTEAGTAGAGGNGGNINLNLPNGFIVAVPIENSDIRANAFEGDGGSVTITAQNLLGISFRPDVLDTPLSDITASSRFGNSGTVTINELAPDVAQDEVALPTETAPTALAQGCRAQGAQAGSFVVTGRGGLPTNPADLLSADAVWQDLAPISIGESNTDRSFDAPMPAMTAPDALMVEAQSWTRAEDGTITLLANATASPDYFVPRVNCSGE